MPLSTKNGAKLRSFYHNFKWVDCVPMGIVELAIIQLEYVDYIYLQIIILHPVSIMIMFCYYYISGVGAMRGGTF